VCIQQEADAFGFQRHLQQCRGGCIQLLIHQAGADMHYRDLHALTQQTVGRFQSQQTAADHHRMAMDTGCCQHVMDIINRAECHDSGQVVTGTGMMNGVEPVASSRRS